MPREYRVLRVRWDPDRIEYTVIAPAEDTRGVWDVINRFAGTHGGLDAAKAYVAEIHARNRQLAEEDRP